MRELEITDRGLDIRDNRPASVNLISLKVILSSVTEMTTEREPVSVNLISSSEMLTSVTVILHQ